MKPGVTGWAQVRYQYGASVDDAVQKLQYDLYYVKNHTLVLDTLVLFETVRVVLTGEGSDELFAGYERYAHYLFNDKWAGRYGAVVPGAVRAAVRGAVRTTPLPARRRRTRQDRGAAVGVPLRGRRRADRADDGSAIHAIDRVGTDDDRCRSARS